jgi:hypothetical protein
MIWLLHIVTSGVSNLATTNEHRNHLSTQYQVTHIEKTCNPLQCRENTLILVFDIRGQFSGQRKNSRVKVVQEADAPDKGSGCSG